MVSNVDLQDLIEEWCEIAHNIGDYEEMVADDYYNDVSLRDIIERRLGFETVDQRALDRLHKADVEFWQGTVDFGSTCLLGSHWWHFRIPHPTPASLAEDLAKLRAFPDWLPSGRQSSPPWENAGDSGEL